MYFWKSKKTQPRLNFLKAFVWKKNVKGPNYWENKIFSRLKKYEKKKVIFFKKPHQKIFFFMKKYVILFLNNIFTNSKNINFTHNWETFQEKSFCWSKKKNVFLFHEKKSKIFGEIFWKKEILFLSYFSDFKSFCFPDSGDVLHFFIEMVSKKLSEVVFFFTFSKIHWKHTQLSVKLLCK